MSRISILTGNHLCHNPRVLKEANTLAEAGFEVEVLGAWFDHSLKARDEALVPRLPFRFVAVIDLTTGNVGRFASRLRTKAAHFADRFCGLTTGYQLGYAVPSMGRVARRRVADLYIAHSEAGLLVGRDLLRSGLNVGVDMEDWFSEDLLPDARTQRPVRLLRELEQELLRNGAHSTCPSHAMKTALATAFGCRAPTVIYNAFAWSDRDSLDGAVKDRRNRCLPSIHWYSQTIGEGRGLEDLLGALPYLDHPAEIHLRGHPTSGFNDLLASQVPDPWRANLFVHDLVSNDELLSRIAEHDIGFAGEVKSSSSRNLTVTNKILHYLLGGLAVVASDTAGQMEIEASARQAVTIYPSGDKRMLATAINRLLTSGDTLSRAKSAALHAAEKTFCWERASTCLLGSVGRALDLANV